MKKTRIIAILTDFGIKDAYVSVLKGVILGICPKVTLVDISHVVSKHDILEGAFILSQASAYFPKDTVFLAVIDPGVGTPRKRLVIQCQRQIYVGPDNGVLSLAAEKEEIINVFEIKNKHLMLSEKSKTFEGRDVFAPVAAHLARGVNVEEFGPKLNTFSRISISKPTQIDGVILGEIVNIDDFGNIITNIPEKMLRRISFGSTIDVSIVRVSKTCKFLKTYSDAPIGLPLITIGSSGLSEIAVNQGNAKALFKVKVGDKVSLAPFPS